MDQLSSKKTAFASAAVVDMVDRWTAAEQGHRQRRGTSKAAKEKAKNGILLPLYPITSRGTALRICPVIVCARARWAGHTIETLFLLDNLDPSINELYP